MGCRKCSTLILRDTNIRIRHWSLTIMDFGAVFVIASVFSNELHVTVIKKQYMIAKQKSSHFSLCLNFHSSVQIKQSDIQLLTCSNYKTLFYRTLLCVFINTYTIIWDSWGFSCIRIWKYSVRVANLNWDPSPHYQHYNSACHFMSSLIVTVFIIYEHLVMSNRQDYKPEGKTVLPKGHSIF